MQIELEGNPDFGEARVQLESGEGIRAASGAMNWMQGPISLKARLLGGLGTSLARRVLGGTSLFITEFSADGDSRLALGHAMAGTLVRTTVTSEGLLIAGGGIIEKHGLTAGDFGGFGGAVAGEAAGVRQ